MGIIIGKSNIHGDGIFTTTALSQGAYVGKLTGQRLTWNYDETQDRARCADWFGLAHNRWLNPALPFSRINHSCEPNIGIKGQIRFYALKPIPPGTELTFDYSTAEEETAWFMTCRCGSSRCRRRIGAIQFLPADRFTNYRPYIPTYFQKVYQRFINLNKQQICRH